MFFIHLPKDGIADETIKLAHHLVQTPSAYWNVSQNKEIKQCMNALIQLKDSGAIGGRPCNLDTCWTFKKSELEKHNIGWNEEFIQSLQRHHLRRNCAINA